MFSALGVEQKLANSLVRFSLGRDSTMEEVERVIAVLPEVVRRAKVPRSRTDCEQNAGIVNKVDKFPLFNWRHDFVFGFISSEFVAGTV